MDSNLGFKLNYNQIQNWVFIPKYYEPTIQEQLVQLKGSYTLVRLGDLMEQGFISVGTGDEIGKMAYGTGKIPFIRTSDISNWEIKTDAKQGVSEKVYKEYAQKQDVKEGDIFFVRDGTYLIGQSAFITQNDLPCLYQSHILKFRVNKDAPVNSYLLFVVLNSPIVKKQIKAKQFTADIIDTIGNRFLELILPIPKDKSSQDLLTKEVKSILDERTNSKENVVKIPLFAQGLIQNLNDTYTIEGVQEEFPHNLGFKKRYKEVLNNIYMPKYYDPSLEEDLRRLSTSHDLISLQDLFDDKVISWNTGIEVGKLAYGTGQIPFVRTSDISNWELKSDPKQCVNEKIYKKSKQDVQPEDIFIVRDGTYLVGTSCMVTESDSKILYCGGIYRLRVENKKAFNPYLLLALLNTPIVKRQMRSKQFTRDIIDTLGKRLFEIILPVPKDKNLIKLIIEETTKTVQSRIILRNKAKEIAVLPCAGKRT